MKTFIHGPSDADMYYTIIGGIHGDEPLTAGVIYYLHNMLEKMDVDTPIRLVIANEKALSAGERYIDVDLNRVIGTTKDTDDHEIQLAHTLDSCLSDSDRILSLHSSKSVPPPFAITNFLNNTKNLVKHFPVDYVLKSSEDGSIEAEYPYSVNLEVGHQQTNQVFYNGIRYSIVFLQYYNCCSVYNSIKPTQTEIFSVLDTLQKGSGEPKIYYANFEEISSGSVIAEDDTITHIASQEGLTPLLFSRYGYSDIFGLLGTRKGYL